MTSNKRHLGEWPLWNDNQHYGHLGIHLCNISVITKCMVLLCDMGGFFCDSVFESHRYKLNIYFTEN